MSKLHPLAVWLAGLALAAALPTSSMADPLTLAELERMIEQALPPQIGPNNAALVQRMLEARIGNPVDDNLDVPRALRTLFGTATPQFSASCRRVVTPVGDLADSDCVAFLGNRNGNGAYSEFAYERNPGAGNVRFLRRPADASLPVDGLPRVAMSNTTAYTKATRFLIDTLGLPPEEFTARLPDARLPIPVRNLILGRNDPRGGRVETPVMKLVKFRRSVEINLPQPVPGEPSTLRIRAPGRAMVTLNDSGISVARIDNWMALGRSPLIDPANAKSRAELVEEIANAIEAESSEAIFDLDAYLVIADPIEEAIPLLLPATQTAGEAVRRAIIPGVELSVAAVKHNASEAAQAAAGPSTAGVIHQFSLVRVGEARAPADD